MVGASVDWVAVVEAASVAVPVGAASSEPLQAASSSAAQAADATMRRTAGAAERVERVIIGGHSGTTRWSPPIRTGP